jgi:hypothetical protein
MTNEQDQIEKLRAENLELRSIVLEQTVLFSQMCNEIALAKEAMALSIMYSMLNENRLN